MFDSRTSILSSPRFLLALALALTLLSYIAICRFDFVYDDHQQIENNVAIRAWDRLPSYFTSHLWANAANQQASNYYRPLFLVWLRLNYLAFGTNPAAWHLTSLLLHLLATFLVFVAARSVLKMAGAEAPDKVAAIAALIFGLHPVHAEPVAWISSSSELMVTCFLLGALACYARARVQARGTTWMVAAVALFCLALLTKETAVAFVFVVLACELLLRTGQPRTAAVKHVALAMVPWMVPAAAYVLVRRIALGELAHPQNTYPATTVIASLPRLLGFYTRHLVWPHPLAILYDFKPATSAGTAQVLLALVFLAALAGCAAVIARRNRVAGVALCWLAVMLVPVLNVRLLRFDAWVQDRYLYLPSFGFALLVAMLLARFTADAARTWKAAVVALIALAMGGVTAQETAPWENDLLLFQNAYAVAPHNAYAEAEFATQLMLRDENDRARALLVDSLTRDPHAWMTAYNLGYLEYRVN
ncbi:MAG: hypothetical protein JO187_05875, partial [Acidobacteria bacterium]|nr:hypothetical protein [Acidobacteriota bacterium]